MKIKLSAFQPTDSNATLLLILAPLFWAGNFILGRILHNSIPPFAFAFYRWLLVIIFLAPFILPNYKSYWHEVKKHFFHILGLSFFSVFIYTSFLYWGLRYTTVVNASLLNAIVPILILFFSFLFLKERINFKKICAIVLSFLGATIVITKGNFYSELQALSFNKGDLLIVCAVMAWAIFSVWYKAYPGKLPAFVFLFTTAILGDALLLPAYLYEIHLGYHLILSVKSIAGILYAAFFSSIIAFSCWNKGVKILGPSDAGYFFNLLPIFSILLAIIFINESIHTYQVIGTTLVFFGILMTRHNGKKRNKSLLTTPPSE